MNFGLDYLSAHLDRSGYDLAQFEREAASPTFIRETGEINNSTIPQSQYRKDIHGQSVVIGTYLGGQYGFSPIVCREGLKVTRVDIKCDVTNWDKWKEANDANDYGFFLKRRIQNYYSREGRRVTTATHKSYSSSGNIYYTHTFGARGSEYQIRIYTKDSELEQVLRIEFQLRKELARSVWEHISPNIYDQSLLSKAFSAIEQLILEHNTLLLDYEASDIEIDRMPQPEASKREVWIRTQVKAAVIKHFKETGVDLSKILYDDIQSYFAGITQSNIIYDQTTERLALE